MKPRTDHIGAGYGRRWLFWASLALAVAFFIPAEAQNTKGDKPVSSPGGQFLRIPRVKAKSKRGDRAYTRDISGRRRIRTKGTSSANRVIYQAPNPYKERHYKKRGDKASTARGKVYNRSPRGRERAWSGGRDGSKLRVRSVSAKAARSNVYPQTGPYVNNKSSLNKKQRVITRTARGKKIYKSKPRGRQGAYAGGANYGSASRPWVTRGRKNVYWGKMTKKGERAVTTDLTGRPVRKRNFHSPSIGAGNSDTLKYAHRRPRGDKAHSGRTGGYVSASGVGEKPWLRDVSGHKVRRRPPRKGERNGLFFEAPRRTLSGKGDKPGRMLPGGGYKTSRKRKGSNTPLPAYTPGIGAGGIAKAMRKTTGYRKRRGGGSVSGKSYNNNGRPIDPRAPGIGANGIGEYRGRFHKGDLSPGFSRAGGDYRGTLKTKRPKKGGGSISGRHLGNNGQPVDVRPPGIGANGIGKFQGTFKRGDLTPGFSRAGGDYRGTLKAKRPKKGGGSVSGRYLGNNGQPVDVKPPGIGANGIGKYRGTFRRGDLSPGFSRAGGDYQGNLKAKKPKKGGGSVSGRTWNNNGNPLPPQLGAPGFDKPASFQGRYKRGDIEPQFGRQGYGFSGNIKGKKKKSGGGGSVSDRPMDNDGKPIDVRLPSSSQAREANYSGKTRLPLSLWNYVQNPNANEQSLKKRKPNPNMYRAEGLQVVIKREKYQKKPNAAEGSMMGIGPGSGSVRASQYDRAIRQTWSYTRNPSSHERALKVIAPGKAFGRLNDYQGNTKMRKYNDSRLHPDAQFAHSYHDNVKGERTIMMNIKMLWAKLFKKNDTQTPAVKAKERKPRYDKKEKELWKDLYD